MSRFIAVLVALAACSKAEPADPVEPLRQDPPKVADAAVKPEPKPVEVEQEPPQTLKQSRFDADLAMIPVDSELVVGVDLAALVTSAVWKQLIEPRVISGAVKTKLAEIKTKCGIDPIATAKRAAIGLRGTSGNAKPDGVIVVYGLDKTKVAACMTKMRADAAGAADITQDGETTIIAPKASPQNTFAFQFLAPDTAVVVLGSKANAAGIKSVVENKQGIATSQTFVRLFNKIDPDKTLWMAMTGQSSAFEQLAMLGIKPRAAFGTLSVADGANLDFRLRLESADQSTQLAQMAKSQATAAKSMISFDKLEFTADGADFKIEIAAAAAKLPTVLKQMQAIQGLGGGGAKP